MNQQQFALPSAQTIVQAHLNNGIAVYVYENPTVQSVVLYGSLRAGSQFDPEGKAGLASMTAAALMRGTQSRDFETLNGTLETIGAEFSYHTGNHRVTFSGRALAEDYATLVDIFADSLQHPVFNADELQEERTKRVTELNYAQQDTRYMATRQFHETLYPLNHSFHYSTYGSVTSLPHINRDDLRAFHDRYYQADGMFIVIVGAIDAQMAITTLNQQVGNWRGEQTIPDVIMPPVALPETTQRIETAIVGKTQADIVLGVAGPSRLAEDYLAAQIANSVLGEFGMMGRVGNIIREQLGLAYYAYSRLDGGAGQGAWTIVAGVAPENVDLTIEKARQEIIRLTQEWISADDLFDNQSYFTGRLPLRLESNYGLASTLHAMAQYQLGMDYLERYHDILFGITQVDVLTAAQHYWHPDKLVISIAG